LSFAAYGTAAPPDIDYNSLNNNYLVVYPKWVSDIDIYGQTINYDGSVGPEFAISNAADTQNTPSVAYDSFYHRSLVVWADQRPGTNGYDIYGQLVNANGTLYGGNFVISNAANTQFSPSVAYDNVNQRFLVVWYDYRPGTNGADIYGQLVNSDGALVGSNFVISNAASDQFNPSVAYNSSFQRFLVSWQDERNSGITDTDIYGQLVNANGTLYSTNFVISNAADDQYSSAIAFDSVIHRFFVVWTDQRPGTNGSDIYGQLVNGDGALVDNNFVISNATDDQYGSVVA
jgi:hypothetical protein